MNWRQWYWIGGVLFLSWGNLPCCAQGSAKALCQSAIGKFQLQDSEAALADLNAAIKKKPNYGLAYYWRARVQTNSGNFRPAVQDLNRAEELKCRETGLYYHRAMAKLHLGDTSLALQDLLRSIEQDRAHADSYYETGKLRLHYAEYREAIEQFDRAIALDSTHSVCYRARGAAYDSCGDFTRSITVRKRWTG